MSLGISARALAAALLALPAISTTAVRGEEHPFPPPRPLDLPWIELGDLDPVIEWRGSWRETVDANRNRWERELREVGVKDARVRGLRVNARVAALLEAVLEKLSPDDEDRFDATRLRATSLEGAGAPDHGRYWRWKLAEDFSDRPLDAAQALAQTFWRRDGEGTATWRELAARRVLELLRSPAAQGRAPESDRLRKSALETLLDVLRSQRRVTEAQAVLEELKQARTEEVSYRIEEAELLQAAGLPERARDVLEASLESAEPESDLARKLAAHLRKLQSGSDPTLLPAFFASDPELLARWRAVEAGTLDGGASDIQSFLEEAMYTCTLVRVDDSLEEPLWKRVDAWLRSGDPALRDAVEEVEERRARAAHAAVTERTREDGLRLYRRYPLAPSAHAALLARADDDLRAGHPGLALRSAEDVIARTADPGVRARATTIRWLALHQMGKRSALWKSLADCAADAVFPWGGDLVPAAAIGEALLDGPAEEPRPASPGPGGSPEDDTPLEVKAASIPPVSLWPPGHLELHDEGELVWKPPLEAGVCAREDAAILATPTVLALFRPHAAHPVWVKEARASRRFWTRVHRGEKDEEHGWDHPSVRVHPSPVVPALTESRVITRWGLDSTRRWIAAIAAFDLESGRTLWTTLGDPSWDDIWPASDPCVAEGHVYVLALTRDRFASAHLVALDERSGRTLWRASITTGRPVLSPNDIPTDLTRQGAAPTFAEGAVYASTTLGVVARVDARDGVLDWVRAYPRISPGKQGAHITRRRGAPPMVAGDLVVFLPRDGVGLFAVESGSGRLAWEEPFAPSRGATWTEPGTIILDGERELAALDPETGRLLWHRRLPSEIDGAPRSTGSGVVIATANEVLQADAATGAIEPLGGHDTTERAPAAAVAGRTLLRFRFDVEAVDTPGPARGDRPPSGGGPVAEEHPQPLLPLWRVLALPRPAARLLEPPPRAPSDPPTGEPAPVRFLLSEGLLERLEPARNDLVRSGRGIPAGLLGAEWAGTRMLLVYPDRAMAVDSETGRTLWDVSLPLRPEARKVLDGVLVLGTRGGPYGSRDPVAALDTETGGLLWRREFDDVFGSFALRAFAWDGARLHLLATADWEGDDRNLDVVCDPRTGRLVDAVHFLESRKGWPPTWDVQDDLFAYVEDGNAVAVTVGAPPERRERRVRLGGMNASGFHRERIRVQVSPPLVRIRQYRAGRSESRYQYWILHRDGSLYPDRGKLAYAAIVDGRLHETVNPTLRVVDLETTEELGAYTVPEEGDTTDLGIQHAWEEGSWMCLASALAARERDGATDRLRVDVFEKETGRHVRTQILPHVAYDASTRLEWAGRSLFVTDDLGLSVFRPAATAESAPGEIETVVPALESALTLDGDTSDWPARTAWELEGRDGERDELRLAHDGGQLFVAVTHVARGVSFSSAGCPPRESTALEVALTTPRDTLEWFVCPSPRGHPELRVPDHRPPPRGVLCAVRQPPGSDELTYELSVPFVTLGLGEEETSPERARVALALKVWDGTTRGGPVPLAEWGTAPGEAGAGARATRWVRFGRAATSSRPR